MKDVSGAVENGADKEDEEGDGECDGDFAAVASEETGGLEVKEGWDGDEVVGGFAQAGEEDGRGHHQGEEPRLKPETLTVEDGEEGQPEEHRVELAAEEGEGDGDESKGGEGGAEEEVELVVVEGAENLACGQLRVGQVHTSE